MNDIQTLSGRWLLVGAGPAPVPVPPPHHVEFLFSVQDGRVSGAIVRQDNGENVPIEVAVDGPRLRLRIIPPAPVPRDQGELPWLVLTRVDGAFEGYWEDASGRRLQPAIALRLVRSTA